MDIAGDGVLYSCVKAPMSAEATTSSYRIFFCAFVYLCGLFINYSEVPALYMRVVPRRTYVNRERAWSLPCVAHNLVQSLWALLVYVKSKNIQLVTLSPQFHGRNMNVGSFFLGPKPLSSVVLLLLDRSVSHNDALGRLASDSSGSRLRPNFVPSSFGANI